MESMVLNYINDNISVVLAKIGTGEIISITFQGREVARLVPPDYSAQLARKRLEQLRKTAFVGDVLSPVGEKWEAEE